MFRGGLLVRKRRQSVEELVVDELADVCTKVPADTVGRESKGQVYGQSFLKHTSFPLTPALNPSTLEVNSQTVQTLEHTLSYDVKHVGAVPRKKNASKYVFDVKEGPQLCTVCLSIRCLCKLPKEFTYISQSYTGNIDEFKQKYVKK